jgi:uncharacterized protein
MEVIVVSDGKKGHVNQSLALAELLGAQCIQVLTQKRLEPARDFMSRFFSFALSPRNYPSSWRRSIMRRCIGIASLPKLNNPSEKPVIIATGTLTSVASLALSGEMGARTLHVLSPSFVPFRLFDAVVLPQHDVSRKPQPSVLTLPIALGPVGGKNVEESLDEMKRRLGGNEIAQGNYIAVLIGGDSAHYVMDETKLVAVVEKLMVLARQSSLRILLTTSRRTPEVIENKLQSLADVNAEVFAFCVWGRTDKFNPIPAYLELAKAVVVTEESVSMVSEAVLAGHKPLIIQLERRDRSRKFPRFYAFLEERNLVRKLPMDGSWDEVCNSALNTPRQNRAELAESIGLPQVITELRKLLKLESAA